MPGVQGAAGRLAGVALAGAVAASNTAVAGVNSSIQTRQPIEPPRLEAPAAQALRPVAPAAMPRVELPRMGVPRLDVPEQPRQVAAPAAVQPVAPVVVQQARQPAPAAVLPPVVALPPMPRIEMPRLALPGPNLAASPVTRLVASVLMPQASAPGPVRVDLPSLTSPMQAAQWVLAQPRRNFFKAEFYAPPAAATPAPPSADALAAARVIARLQPPPAVLTPEEQAAQAQAAQEHRAHLRQYAASFNANRHGRCGAMSSSTHQGRDTRWAQRAVELFVAGEPVSHRRLHMACEVLGIDPRSLRKS